ncbi:hypothetical protein KR222_007108, partial [Zaprionus bogoriensis]
VHLSFRYLRKNQPLPLYFYAVPRLCLNPMGYWPGPRGTLPWRAPLNFVILAIGVVTELHAGLVYAQSSEITLALETLCPAATSAVTLLKMFLMLRYRHDLFHVVTQQRDLLFGRANRISATKDVVMHKHALMAARFNFWPLSAGFCTATTYNVKPLLLALVLYLQGRYQENVWGMPFNMTMPHFLLQAPFFPVTFVFIAYTGYVTIFMFGGCDAFYFEFCVNTGTLFKSLAADIRALFRPYQGEVAAGVATVCRFLSSLAFILFYAEMLRIEGVHAERFEELLVVLIKRHNQIIELTQFFRQRYWIITLAHFVSASMVIGFSIFNLMTIGDNGLGALLYVSYTVAALSQLLIYCYGGTLVAENSAQLGIVMGSCPWHLCLPKHRRFVHLFILRVQRSVTMAVPFFSPSLNTFAAVRPRFTGFFKLFELYF